MIHFLQSNSPIPKSRSERVILDFIDASSRSDVVLKLGRAFKGSSSPVLKGAKLDALQDVMSEWVTENGRKRIDAYLVNAQRIDQLEKHLLVTVVDVIHSALFNGLAEINISDRSFDLHANSGNLSS